MVTTFHQSSENDFFLKYKTHQLQKKSTNEQFYINPAKKIPNWLHQQQKRKKSTHNKDQQILKTAQASAWF